MSDPVASNYVLTLDSSTKPKKNSYVQTDTYIELVGGEIPLEYQRSKTVSQLYSLSKTAVKGHHLDKIVITSGFGSKAANGDKDFFPFNVSARGNAQFPEIVDTTGKAVNYAVTVDKSKPNVIVESIDIDGDGKPDIIRTTEK